MITEKIKIKYFADIEKIEKIEVGDWVDLRASQEMAIAEGQFRLIPLGVGMILPEGYEALVLPRSSLFIRTGLLMANSVGVIDNSYSGDEDEWNFPVYATHNIVIRKGQRIAQFRIIKSQPKLEFEEVDKLNDISRGGFGSTGDK